MIGNTPRLRLAAVTACALLALAGTTRADLIGLYRFEGSTTADLAGSLKLGTYAGQTYDGTASGDAVSLAADVPAGLFGTTQSLQLGGTFDFVELPFTSVNPFDSSGDFTITSWFKSTATGGQRAIMSSGREGNFSADHGMAFFVHDAGGGNLRQDNFYVNQVNTGSNLHDSDWHFGAVTFTAAGNVHNIYVDNMSAPATKSFDPNIPNIAAHRVLIGSTLNTRRFPDPGHWQGNLDDVAVFDHALTSAELAAVQQGDFSAYANVTGPPPPPPPPAPDLLFHYTFDDGTATSSTGSNHGTVTGATGDGTAKIGPQALRFDGNGDWVENVNLGTRQEMSYSFWYNTPNGQQCCSTGGLLYTNGGWGNDSLHSNLNSGSSRIWNEVHSGNQRNSGYVDTALNTWNHITAVFDNGEITYYVNGEQDPAGSQSLSGPDVRLDVSRIGAWNTSRYYTGLMDDWALWADPLDAGQAKAIFDLGDQLGYNQAEARELFLVFDETLDSATIGSLTWYRDDSLTGNPLGLVDLGDGDYGLVLDARGRGVSTVSAVIPEPGSFALMVLGLLGFAVYARRRR